MQEKIILKMKDNILKIRLIMINLIFFAISFLSQHHIYL